MIDWFQARWPLFSLIITDESMLYRYRVLDLRTVSMLCFHNSGVQITNVNTMRRRAPKSFLALRSSYGLRQRPLNLLLGWPHVIMM